VSERLPRLLQPHVRRDPRRGIGQIARIESLQFLFERCAESVVGPLARLTLARGTRPTRASNGADGGAHLIEREREPVQDERAETLGKSRGNRDRGSRHTAMLPLGSLHAEGLAEALAETGFGLWDLGFGIWGLGFDRKPI